VPSTEPTWRRRSSSSTTRSSVLCPGHPRRERKYSAGSSRAAPPGWSWSPARRGTGGPARPAGRRWEGPGGGHHGRHSARAQPAPRGLRRRRDHRLGRPVESRDGPPGVGRRRVLPRHFGQPGRPDPRRRPIPRHHPGRPRRRAEFAGGARQRGERGSAPRDRPAARRRRGTAADRRVPGVVWQRRALALRLAPLRGHSPGATRPGRRRSDAGCRDRRGSRRLPLPGRMVLQPLRRRSARFPPPPAGARRLGGHLLR